MSIGRRAAWAVLMLGLAAACAAPPSPTLPPATATPNAVETGLALLTASFASLTPTMSEMPSTTPTASQTQRVATSAATPSQTIQFSTASATLTPSQTIRVSETLRASSRTPTTTPRPRVSTTAMVTGTVSLTPTATMTATVPLTMSAGPRIVPGNAMSLTLAAVLGPVVISGTGVVRLDQAAWAPDGQLAAAGAGGLLFVSGDALTATQGYTIGLWTPTVAFSPDGLALAAGSVGGTVRLFRRDDGALLFQLVQPGLRVSQVRYRPGPPGVLAQDLASLSGDNTIYLWDVAYRKFLGALSPGPSSAAALEFSGDGHWLAAASGSDALVWDMIDLPATGWAEPVSPILTLPQGGQVTGLALSQDGFWLAAANATGTIALWTVPGGQSSGEFVTAGVPAVRLAFSPDGRLVAAAGADHTIRLWSLEAAGRSLAVLAGHTGPITSLAFNPDGTSLASSSWDGTVRIWQVGGGN